METIEKVGKRQKSKMSAQIIKAGEPSSVELYSFVLAICRKALTKRVFNITKYEREIRAHDIATALLSKLDNVKPGMNMAGYFWTGACNAIVDYYRRNKKTANNVSIDIEPEYETNNFATELISDEPDPSESLCAKERQALLMQAISQGLTETERHILMSHEFGGVSMIDLANEQQVTVNSLYIRLFRIKAKLKKILTEEMNFRKEDLY